MLLLHNVGAVLAARALAVRRHRQGRILRHLRARRQVLAARALAARHILPLLRPRSPIPRLLHLRPQAAVHLAARALVLPVQVLDQFLAVHAARRRLPALVVHQEVLLQKAMAYRAKKATAGRPIPTKAVLTSSAIIALAP